MIGKKKVLAVILARGGSKRIPGKNLIKVNGNPLLYYTFESSKNSKYIDEVILSSDDIKIIEFSTKNSIRTIKRPKSISQDDSTSICAILHILENIKEEYDEIILLQPTSPLRTSADIDNALEYYYKIQANSVISVCKLDYHPEHINQLPANNSMKNFLTEENSKKITQKLKAYYKINGAIYIANIAKLKSEESFFLKEKSYAYIMDSKKSIDIDTFDDLRYAEYLLKSNVS